MTIDHLVYAVPDLSRGIEHIEAVLGLRASPGGQHPGQGTRNALVALGPATYLEIVGPDPEQPKPPRPRWFRIDELEQPKLVTWAAKSSALEQVIAEAQGAGLVLGETVSGSRRRGDGILLSWRYTDPRALPADGIIPFFIDWGTTPHPAQSAGPGASLIRLRAEHPEAERVGAIARHPAIARHLGVDLEVQAARRPALVALVQCPHGQVELR